ncbi:hypothetical protein [Dysgonomonas reticulitermitis]
MKIKFLSLLGCCFLLSASVLHAQNGKVGVNTDNPRKNLDVRGQTRLSGAIFFGDDDNTDGHPGEDGQFLLSKGPSQKPEWATVDIPVVEVGGFYMQGSSVYSDAIGLQLYRNNDDTSNGYSSGQPHNEDDLLYRGPNGTRHDRDFYPFPQLDESAGIHIIVPDTVGLTAGVPAGSIWNRTVFQVQTVVQMPNTGTWVTYTIGIFLKMQGESVFKLKGCRVGRLAGGAQMFQTQDLTCILDNLPPGRHQVIVAGKRRDTSGVTATSGTNFFGMGKAAYTNLNGFTTRTTLKIEVYKKDNSNLVTP